MQLHWLKSHFKLNLCLLNEKLDTNLMHIKSMKVSPISWQNHSTCPRLDMSGLAWKFNNFPLHHFLKMQNIKSLRFLPVLPIATVEAWQNQLGIRPFLFRIKLQIFQLFYGFFYWGKSITFESSNKNAKFSIFEPGRNGKVEETWIQSVNIYQVIPAENIRSDQKQYHHCH